MKSEVKRFLKKSSIRFLDSGDDSNEKARSYSAEDCGCAQRRNNPPNTTIQDLGSVFLLSVTVSKQAVNLWVWQQEDKTTGSVLLGAIEGTALLRAKSVASVWLLILGTFRTFAAPDPRSVRTSPNVSINECQESQASRPEPKPVGTNRLLFEPHNRKIWMKRVVRVSATRLAPHPDPDRIAACGWGFE